MDFKKILKENIKKDYKEIKKISSLPYGYVLVEIMAGLGNCRSGFSSETENETIMMIKPKEFSFTKNAAPLLTFFPREKNLLVSVRMLAPMVNYTYVHRRYEVKRKKNGEVAVKKNCLMKIKTRLSGWRKPCLKRKRLTPKK